MTDATFDLRAHWENVYATRAPEEVSWFQERPETSLGLVRAAKLGPTERIVDVGGGASRLVDGLLDGGFTAVTVADVSATALERAKARLGARADEVRWVVGDVTRDDLGGPFDLWHDRAVFHFLVDPADRARYRERLHAGVGPGAHVIVATFALDGPERCSGLPVHRWEPDALAAELGLAIEETRREAHMTPAGRTQQFVFVYGRVRSA